MNDFGLWENEYSKDASIEEPVIGSPKAYTHPTNTETAVCKQKGIRIDRATETSVKRGSLSQLGLKATTAPRFQTTNEKLAVDDAPRHDDE